MTKLDFSKMEGLDMDRFSVHSDGPWVWDDGCLVGAGGFLVAWCTQNRAGFTGITGADDDLNLIAAAPDMKDEIIRQREVIERLANALDGLMGAYQHTTEGAIAMDGEGSWYKHAEAILKESKGGCNE